jgi:hypothetical protein
VSRPSRVSLASQSPRLMEKSSRRGGGGEFAGVFGDELPLGAAGGFGEEGLEGGAGGGFVFDGGVAEIAKGEWVIMEEFAGGFELEGRGVRLGGFLAHQGVDQGGRPVARRRVSRAGHGVFRHEAGSVQAGCCCLGHLPSFLSPDRFREPAAIRSTEIRPPRGKPLPANAPAPTPDCSRPSPRSPAPPVRNTS